MPEDDARLIRIVNPQLISATSSSGEAAAWSRLSASASYGDIWAAVP
jgi:hypothetical protein